MLDCGALGDILVDIKAYSPDRRAFIVDMMRGFALYFDFPDSNGRAAPPKTMAKKAAAVQQAACGVFSPVFPFPC